MFLEPGFIGEFEDPGVKSCGGEVNSEFPGVLDHHGP